nr:MAG TPA: hypothetical protein [Bacteriophage sp.]
MKLTNEEPQQLSAAPECYYDESYYNVEAQPEAARMLGIDFYSTAGR